MYNSVFFPIHTARVKRLIQNVIFFIQMYCGTLWSSTEQMFTQRIKDLINSNPQGLFFSAENNYTKVFSAENSYTKVFSAANSYTKVFSSENSYTMVFSAENSYSKVSSAENSYTKVFSAENSYTKVFSAENSYTKVFLQIIATLRFFTRVWPISSSINKQLTTETTLA